MRKQTVHCKTILLIFAIGLFVIGVVNVGDAIPFFVNEGDTATRSVDENAAVGTDVGSLFIINKDSFKLIGFNFPDYNDKFEYVIVGNKEAIQIRTKVRLNYEVQSSYTVNLILKYFDGDFDPNESFLEEADRVTVTINVNDMPERPTLPFPFPSTGDALPTFTSEERAHLVSLLTLDTIIFNELFNTSNDPHDWIELRNVTDADIDLSGWSFIVATGETIEVFEFPTGIVLPAGELLLLLNTDPDEPDMPLAPSEEASYHSLVDEAFILPQKDFMLLLRSPEAWEDSAGGYLFGREKSPMTVDFALDTAWFRAKTSIFGHEAEAWRVSGHQDGLGYDAGVSEDISLGTPGYPQSIRGDVNADGVVDILDLVLVASHFGASDVASADLNGDGTVDIQDLVMVANTFGDIAAAPSVNGLTAAHLQAWLRLAKEVGSHPIQTPVSQREFSYERGIRVLEQLRLSLIPKTTLLLPNYPNPFNPETWMPYHLAKASEVQITIYDARGRIVRSLSLGHQAAGRYTSRSRAAYWDGANDFGESVASGIYFYTLTAGEFSATRKMLILK